MYVYLGCLEKSVNYVGVIYQKDSMRLGFLVREKSQVEIELYQYPVL